MANDPADLTTIPAALADAQQRFDAWNRLHYPPRPPEFFALELAGETGELANKEKKVWRARTAPGASPQTPLEAGGVTAAELAEEAADVFIALVNYCNARGVALGPAVGDKLRVLERRVAERQGGHGKPVV